MFFIWFYFSFVVVDCFSKKGVLGGVGIIRTRSADICPLLSGSPIIVTKSPVLSSCGGMESRKRRMSVLLSTRMVFSIPSLSATIIFGREIFTMVPMVPWVFDGSIRLIIPKDCGKPRAFPRSPNVW